MSTFIVLIISGERYHGHFFRGNHSNDVAQDKEQFLGRGRGRIVSEKKKEKNMAFQGRIRRRQPTILTTKPLQKEWSLLIVQ